jgi:hypothetical protein
MPQGEENVAVTARDSEARLVAAGFRLFRNNWEHQALVRRAVEAMGWTNRRIFGMPFEAA